MVVPAGEVTVTTTLGDPRQGARYDLTDAQDTAYRALTAAQNARQMVLNRDPALTSLQQTASQFGSVTAAADAIHQQLADRITAQEQRQMTPGPKGDPGQDGAPGIDGKSAYQLARDGGYGGTQTQWLTSLKGLDGAAGQKGDVGPQGAPGTPADMSRVAALEAKTVIWETASYSATAIVALNGNLSLTFTWQSALPAAPTKVRLLSPVPLINIVYGTPTTTGCTVTAKAGLAVAIGATFHLIAIRYA